MCYDHLAGDLGVRLFESLSCEGWIDDESKIPHLTDKGKSELQRFGIDLATLATKRRPLCRSCLDWSVRRSHLAGSVGAELLNRFYALRWAKRVDGTRIVQFSASGEKALRQQFGLP